MLLHRGLDDLHDPFLEECRIAAARARMGVGRAEHQVRDPEPLLAGRHQVLTGVGSQVHGDDGEALAADIEHQAAGVDTCRGRAS